MQIGFLAQPLVDDDVGESVKLGVASWLRTSESQRHRDDASSSLLFYEQSQDMGMKYLSAQAC